MREAQWGDWFHVTDFDIRTALLRNVKNSELLSSPEKLRGNLTNDLCAGLAYLYLDSLSAKLQDEVGRSEFSPYQERNWPLFKEFLSKFPRGFELFMELSRFHSLLMFERDEQELLEKRRRWKGLFVGLLMDFPESNEIRICYLLGKALLKPYIEIQQDRPISGFYYLTMRKSAFESYEKSSSVMIRDFISE